MTTTNLTNLLVNGVPTIGTGGLLPYTGKYFFVNATTGSDGNTGEADQPFATLDRAYSLATAGNNDVIFLTGTVRITSTLTWAKNAVHLIGLTAPSQNDRARISQTGSSVFTPLVNVTAEGCVFMNIATFHGFASATTQICWNAGGGRNFYSNVQFLGMGNATAAAQAGGRSLTVTGDTGENLFENCTIGLDTVTRATNANASLEFTGGSPRNVFRNCIFQSLVSAAGDLHITVGSGGIDRFALFENCSFFNAIESGATAMSVAIIAHASAGGMVVVQNPMSVGATKIASTGPVYIIGPVPTAGTSGLGIKAT